MSLNIQLSKHNDVMYLGDVIENITYAKTHRSMKYTFKCNSCPHEEHVKTKRYTHCPRCYSSDFSYGKVTKK